jgi:hypothetical protein
VTPRDFIERWAASAGAENANAQSFVSELCDLLGVQKPEPAQSNEANNNYVFEKRVDHKKYGGKISAKRIDCYKRDHFILEAKQSSDSTAKAAMDDSQGEMLPEETAPRRGGTAKRGTKAWDLSMRSAYN